MAELHISFAGGMDEATRSELVDPQGSLLTVENAFHTKRGALTKSLGFTALTSAQVGGTTRTVGKKLLTRRNELCVVDGNNLGSYSSAATAWSIRDQVPQCSVRRSTLPQVQHSSPSGHAELITVNGYHVALSTARSSDYTQVDVYVSIVDVATLSVVSGPTAIVLGLNTFGESAQLTYVGNVVFAVWVVTGSSAIRCAYLDLTSAATIAAGWTIPGDLCADYYGATNVGEFDCCATTASRWALVYPNNSGGASRVTVKTVSNVGAVLETATIACATNDASCGINGDGDTLWIGVRDGTNTNIKGLTASALGTVRATLATIIAAGTATNGIGIYPTGAGTGVLVIDAGLPASVYWRQFATSGGAAVATGATSRIFNSRLVHRPWGLSGRSYCTIKYDATFANDPQLELFVVDITADTTQPVRPVAHPAARLSYTKGPFEGTPLHVTIVGAKVYAGISVLRSSSVTGTELLELDWGFPSRWQASQLGNVTALSGGVPTYFDGVRISEQGFLLRPPVPIVALGAGALTGTYRYVALFEQLDANGEVHWSTPSTPSAAIAPAGANGVNVTVGTLGITSRQDLASALGEPNIVLYRTDASGAGTYYRLSSVAGHPIVNIASAGTVTFNDQQIDATLTGNAPLYRLPGVIGAALARQSPPAMYAICQFGDRFVGLADDGISVFFSGPRVIGEGQWFSDAQQFPVDGDGYNTAIWTQDGRLVIAKESSLYVVDGDGPPDNGGNGTEFSIPRLLPSDVGCIESRSIVTTVLGTFFLSRRGIELLDRKFQVAWVGERVQDALALFPNVTSATLDVEGSRVIFTCAAGENASGVFGNGAMLIYDLTINTWSVDKHHGASAAQPAQSACMSLVNGIPRLHWLSAAGVVYRENLAADATAYLDGSTWRTLTTITPWFKLAGLAGYQQIRKIQLLCSKDTDHDLAISYAVNDSTSFSTPRTYTRAEINALDREHLEVVIGNDQKCRSIQFKFVDATPTGGTVGSGKGTTLYGLSIEYETLQELARRTPSAR